METEVVKFNYDGFEKEVTCNKIKVEKYKKYKYFMDVDLVLYGWYGDNTPRHLEHVYGALAGAWFTAISSADYIEYTRVGPGGGNENFFICSNDIAVLYEIQRYMYDVLGFDKPSTDNAVCDIHINTAYE